MEEKRYRLCEVKFFGSNSFYVYLTKDYSLEVGDYVEVMAQGYNQVVTVVNLREVQDIKDEEVLEKLKKISRLIKKHNEPVSKEKSLFYIPIEDNIDEDTSLEGLFECLNEIEYKAGLTLTKEEISFFEQVNNIKLPVQYREMLLKKGNGLTIAYKKSEADESYVRKFLCFKFRNKKKNNEYEEEIQYRTIKGISWKRKILNDRLSKPFMFGNKIFVNKKDFNFPQFKDCMIKKYPEIYGICYVCDHRYDCIHSRVEVDCDSTFYNGTLELTNSEQGKIYSYYLILNGPSRGQVWFSEENKNFSLYAKSFKEFLEKVCTEKQI
ncbi:MAG TPA: hypothetical protein PK626_01910 [Bacteroidales bacterium]|nr:hypothetical protein [Bacteroidales bacterium]HQA84686.1 hypothetical protein [Erysipelotrichaceae bacterium]